MDKNKKKIKLRLAILKQIAALATGGFGLVAALAWNSLIQEFVNNYIKKYLDMGSGLISLLFYAVLVTVLAVFVAVQLSTLIDKLEEEQESP